MFLYRLCRLLHESDVCPCTDIVTFLIVVAESRASVFHLRQPAVSRLMTRVAGTCGGVAISLVTTRYHLQRRR